MDQPTRITLLQRLKESDDTRAWEEFSQLYLGLIYSYAHARGLSDADASDVAADCMRVLWSRMRTFDYDRRKGRFRAWLRRMVNNRVNNMQRRWRLDRQAQADLSQHSSSQLSPDQLWEQKWQTAHMLYCLRQLELQVSAEHFQAFRLYALEQQPVEEVARVCKMTPNQIYVIKSRLSTRLRESLQAMLNDSPADPDELEPAPEE
ncbi:MAG: hypothetical protein HJJLKODD_00978 [Phycisphaerae bacterium]|nr:hypothetical protein [Phycisphaerae bacterium]